MTTMTFDEAWLRFCALEREFDLPEWTVRGVRIWKPLRFTIFSAFWRPEGRGTAAPAPAPPTKVQRLRRLVGPVLRRNPLLHRSDGIRRVVIPSPRKRMVRGRLVDPVSLRAWSGPHEPTSLILDTVSRIDPRPLPGMPSNEFFPAVAQLAGRFVPVRLDASDHTRVRAIEDALGRMRVPLAQRVTESVRAFVVERALYARYLASVRPAALYLVCSYGKEAAIDAAQSLGIRTAEFQHGSLGRGHAGYDFPGWARVPYFPDYMLAFGTDWFAECALPKSCALDAVGAPHIEDAANDATSAVTRNERQLLVISQWSQSGLLAGEILKFVRRRPDWRVVVRPHPTEDAGALRRLYADAGVIIDDGRTLAEHAAESAVVTGVSSTALLEAALSGCRLVLMRIERGPSYYESSGAMRVASGDELADRIDDADPTDVRGYFARPVADVVARVEASQ